MLVNVWWYEQVEADLPSGDDWLSAPEKARLANFRIPKRREEWCLGRWTAKRAVVARMSQPPPLSQIELRPAPSGAPEVFCSGDRLPFSISLSHRSGRAACAVTEATLALGCDLELVEPRSEAFVDDYFTAREQGVVAATPADQRPVIVALLWSAKESVLKVTQEGLRCDTRSVVVTEESLRQLGEHGCRYAESNEWSSLRLQHTETRRDYVAYWQRTSNLIRTLAVPAEAHAVQIAMSD